ncbi:MAG TPA: hypothetical protein VGK64_30040 [Bryobacteraceae bacterium]
MRTLACRVESRLDAYSEKAAARVLADSDPVSMSGIGFPIRHISDVWRDFSNVNGGIDRSQTSTYTDLAWFITWN